MKKEKKPFRETRFGIWLKQHDSDMFEFVANRIGTEKAIGKIAKAVLLTLAKITDEKRKEGGMIKD